MPKCCCSVEVKIKGKAYIHLEFDCLVAMADDKSVYQLDLQTVGEISVKSNWQQEKTFNAAKCQTEPEYKDHTGTQTNVSALTVTEALDKSEGTTSRTALVPLARMDGTQYVYNGNHFHEDSLLTFLEGLKDDMLAMLGQNTRSNAFDHYEPNWSGRAETVTKAFTLTAPHIVEAEWHVSALAWNCTGTIVAAAYGRLDTTGWCKQRGYVCCWNLSRRNFDPEQPNQIIETDSYATALSFHPIQPSVVAIGTYNGEVALWNVSSSEEAQRSMTSQTSTNGHREPISQLQWLQNAQEPRETHRYVLCSASQDGKILFWSPTNKLADPIANYEVQNKRRSVVGIQTMSFMRSTSAIVAGAKGRLAPPGLENLMLLGVESGELFRTKPGITAAVRQGTAAAAAGSSVLEVDHFDAHKGPVNALDCSPFFRNLFLTASSDGCLRLFSTMERTPLCTLEPSSETRHYLYGAEFSPFRAAVFACVSRNGSLYIYDLEQSRSKPIFSAEASVDGTAATALSFNPTSAQYLATGDAKGHVTLWQLSSELTQLTDLERNATRSMEAASPSRGPSSGAAAEDDASSKSDPVRSLFGFGL